MVCKDVIGVMTRRASRIARSILPMTGKWHKVVPSTLPSQAGFDASDLDMYPTFDDQGEAGWSPLG